MLSPPLDLDCAAALGRNDEDSSEPRAEDIWCVSAHCFVILPSSQEDGVFQPQNEYM